MRTIRRLALGGVTLVALSTAAAGIALAGNFAAVTFLDGAADPPVAGEVRDIHFSLLQHGVTPISDGDVTLTATPPGPGAPIAVPATSLGGGEWVATVTFPTDGDWQVRVIHGVFETSPATTFSVGTTATLTAAGAAQPWPFLALAALVALALAGVAAIAIARVRRDDARVIARV